MAEDVVGRAWYELGARDEQLDRTLQGAESDIKASGKRGADSYAKSWDDGSKRIGSSLNTVRNSLAAIGIGIGLATVVNFFGGAVGAASDLNEEVSKASVVFGDASGQVVDFASKADRALGQSQQQALGAAGAFGNMFRTIGFADEAAANMSIRMVELASDMASFNNQDPSDMLERLRSGLSGEAEPLRQFGVLISEARVKTKAYEIGLAEAGSELTEQQKVIARYNLILEDTALQQGDFARTSEGLANSQRIQAASWENSLARIGQALLPLAKELTQFATDVMPGVADSILGVLQAGEPLLQFTLTLAKLWLEHIDIILPALIALLGVKMVGALTAAEIRTKGLALALRGLRAAALLGIPFLVEGVEEVGDGIDRWWESLTEGREGARAIEELRQAMADLGQFATAGARQLHEWGISAEEFARLVEFAGGDVKAAFDAIVESEGDLSRAFGSLNTDIEALDGSFRRLPGDINEAAGAAEEAAGNLGDAMTRPIADRLDDATANLTSTLDEWIRIIESREDDLRNAGQGAIDAWYEPLELQLKIAAVEAELGSKELRDKLASENPNIVRDGEQRRLALTKELLELKQAQATVGDETAQIAAQQSLLTSQFMRDGLASEDPQIRALFELWRDSLRNSILTMEADARGNEAGANLNESLERERPRLRTTAGGIREDISGPLETMAGEGFGWGANVIDEFLRGVRSRTTAAREAAIAIANGISGPLESASPPREGPLREIDKWGFSIGRTWVENIAKGASASSVLGALGGPQLALAGALPGAAFGGGGAPTVQAGRGDTIYHLYFNGRSAGTARDPMGVVDEVGRLDVFTD